MIVAAQGAYLDVTRRGTRCESVPDRVLHQWLQNKCRDQSVARSVIDFHVDGEPVFEPDLLNRDIMPQDRQLTVEWHFLVAAALQRDADQLSKPQYHSLGRVRVRVHERGDGIQRVEQKMRP